jgi:hypothetical protein
LLNLPDGPPLGGKVTDLIVPLLYSQHPAKHDIDQHWVPLFYGADPSTPIELWTEPSAGERAGWSITLSGTKGRYKDPIRFSALSKSSIVIKGAIDKEGDLTFDPGKGSNSTWWGPSSPEPDDAIGDSLLDVFLQGDLPTLVPPLKRLNPDIEAIDLAGDRPYIRLKGHKRPLPIGVLGDGARRVLEFALGLHPSNDAAFFDEVENGLHIRSLPAVLGMFQAAAPTTQIFATTHRDELVRIACEVFLGAGDDSLRVFRIDRRGDAHAAVSYTAAEALSAMDAGLEIRG